jgi:tRNA(Ile)-lysidine synthase
MLDLSLHIEENWKQLSDQHLFVACSGGVESIVLLHLLKKHPSVSVIHVNYQLRGEDSTKDAKFVSATCKSLCIPCDMRTFDLAEQLKSGGNLQELARDVRYEWFNEILSNNPDNRILLAHHADDQVETFFLNLARKSGVMGLACMKSEHNRIIRPLLKYSKKDLINYAESKGIEWREDLSNESVKYRRNRLRNELIPEVKREIPTIDSSVLTLIDSFQVLQKSLETSVQAFIQVIRDNGTLSFDNYATLNSLERIELLRQLEVPVSVSVRLEKLYQGQKGKRIELKHADYSSIVRDHSQFTFVASNKRLPTLESTHLESLPVEFSKDEILLDLDKVNGQLSIRTWKNNDRISPLGMTGTQLISDIIKDSHLTAQAKNDLIILHDATEIHACFGLKIGRKAIATDKSKRIIKCSLLFE